MNAKNKKRKIIARRRRLVVLCITVVLYMSLSFLLNLIAKQIVHDEIDYMSGQEIMVHTQDPDLECIIYDKMDRATAYDADEIYSYTIDKNSDTVAIKFMDGDTMYAMTRNTSFIR